MTKDWREEFDERFLHPDGRVDEYEDLLKSFITSLIETERAAAVAEYQAKLNDEGLGEDNTFDEFCDDFVTRLPEIFKAYQKKIKKK